MVKGERKGNKTKWIVLAKSPKAAEVLILKNSKLIARCYSPGYKADYQYCNIQPTTKKKILHIPKKMTVQ